MFIALLWKSFREILLTVPLAMVVLSVITYLQMPARSDQVQSTASSYASLLACLGGAYAMVLGLLQTWPLRRTDVRGWLFSHPAPRWHFYFADLFAAVAAYLLAILVPWGIAWIWLGQVAPATRPASPWDLMPGLLVYLAALSFHPASVWMMNRPSSWFGSRTFVLALPGLLTFLAFIGLETALPAWGWGLVIATVVLFVVLYPLIAGEAYTRLSNAPSRVYRRRSDVGDNNDRPGFARLAYCVAVLASTAIVCLAAWMLVVVPLDSSLFAPTQGLIDDVMFAGDGNPCFVRKAYVWNEDRGYRHYETQEAWLLNPELEMFHEVSQLEPVEANQIANLKQASYVTNMSWFGAQPPFREFVQDYFGTGPGGLSWHPTYDGVYHAYVPRQSVQVEEDLLQVVMDRNGFGSTEAPFHPYHAITNFSSALESHLPSPSLTGDVFFLADAEGLYQASLGERRVETLLSEKIDGFAVMIDPARENIIAFILAGDTLRLYAVESDEPGVALPKRMTEEEHKRGGERAPWPRLRFDEQIEIKLPPDWYAPLAGEPTKQGLTHWLLPRLDGGWLLIQQRAMSSIKRLDIDASNQIVARTSYYLPRAKPSPLVRDLLVTSLIPVVTASAALFELAGPQNHVELPRVTDRVLLLLCLGFVLAHSLLAWWFTEKACTARRLSIRSTTTWRCASVFLGLITPLLVLSFHHRIASVSCHACDRMIRVDEPRCPHCTAAWKPVEHLGIEVF
ncbi:MAG: hypothetical protein AAGD07_20725 [Planctomycetota bacterium]